MVSRLGIDQAIHSLLGKDVVTEAKGRRAERHHGLCRLGRRAKMKSNGKLIAFCKSSQESTSILPSLARFITRMIYLKRSLICPQII